jgi:hypothetical protein
MPTGIIGMGHQSLWGVEAETLGKSGKYRVELTGNVTEKLAGRLLVSKRSQ